MAVKKSAKKGIFCMETDRWYRQKDTHTVEPILQLIERVSGAKYEHHDIATSTEFEYCLTRYLKRGYKNYPILYLGFHGWSADEVEDDAHISLSDGTNITLNQMEEWIDGRCKDRFIYIGSCGVLQTHLKRLKRFVQNTGAVALAGYKEEIDWLESATFDMLALGQLQNAAFVKNSIRKFANDLETGAKTLHKRLGFRVVQKD